MAGNKLRPSLTIIGFSVLILVPSFDTLLRYSGVYGTLAYFLVGTAALAIWFRYILPAFESKLNEGHTLFLVLLTFGGLIAITAYVYPLANSGGFGSGGDADDALVIAAGAILHGHYPYYDVTYLGNLISPMSGAVFLSIPFAATSAIYLQNVFWLAILFFVFRYYEKSSRMALGLIWTLLIFCPTVWQNLVTGGDYLANSIYILVFMWLSVRRIAETDGPVWNRFLPAVLLGVGLSSRSNFFLLIPLLLSILVQRAGWKPAIVFLGLTGIVFALVTVPFWIYDPAGFSPLIVQAGKMEMVDAVLPFAAVFIPLLGTSIASALALQKMEADCTVFFRSCAIVQICVLLFTCTLFSIRLGHLDFFMGQAGYGMFTLIFGASAFLLRYLRGRTGATISPELAIQE